ncbi:hypothetical protein GT045_16640 [Streptomyces sp. SID486]|uniref:hypothetical protein n=1 Tax=unclassified Streptomyces TaxID=2593676 RepID=UPI0013705BED|nr:MULTISPECIES: hypothetical protein [unclassified Streptomyces]MYW18510.1 hypothetical protein [Streptomyces sp. SID2955]MYW45249.1 hypothetical protein [Streptomyces sp. SID161]MYX96395.1 hypothetical protein [Streptomyces sp. SID486]
MDDEPRSTGTARLLGSYWLDSSYHRSEQPCCCFASPPRRRSRPALIARTVLSVTSYALVLTALALIVTG